MTYPQMDPRRLDLTGSFGLRVANRDAAEVRIGTAGRWGQRVNLATNPSFEATSGTVVVATNLHPTPVPSMGGWSARGQSEIGEYTHGLTSEGIYRVDRAPDDNLNYGWLRITTPYLLAADSGKTVTAVARVRTDGATIVWNRYGGGTAEGSAMTPVPTPGEWVTVSYKAATPPAGAAYRFEIGMQANTPGRGRWLEVEWIDVYEGDYQPHRQFFHGDHSPDPDLTPAWTGAVNGSKSTLSGQVVAGVDGGIASTQRPGLPLRVLDAGHITDWPATGVVRASIDTEDGREALTSPDLPPGWYGRLLIEDVTDAAPEDADYFDGDTPNTPAALHHWTATPHASTSVQTLAWTPGD